MRTIRFSLLLPLLVTTSACTRQTITELTPDGAWCWFSDPRAIIDRGTMYAGWMNSEGSVQIGATDQRSRQTQIETIKEKFEVDDHDCPALLQLPDGRLAAFFSLHAAGDMHLRITTKPRDISQWTDDRTLGFGAAGKGTTYANPAMLSDENNAIYLFWRGNDFKPNFSVSRDQLQTFSPPRTLIQRPGANNDNRPYTKVWNDGKSRIDLIFTDGHPRNERNNSVYFVRYENGGFFKADGTRIGGLDDLPLDPASCDKVYDGATAGRAWVWDICEDAKGNPVLTYTRLPAETDHRYHYARWNGSAWDDHEIVAAGGWFPQTPPGTREREPHYSGGISIDPQHPQTVYLSRPVDGVFEIERWSTPDGGASWKSEPITQHSTTSQVRPFVVRGAPAASPVLTWMDINEKYLHYTNFKTRLLMTLPNA
jgi:hypothetical protein